MFMTDDVQSSDLLDRCAYIFDKKEKTHLTRMRSIGYNIFILVAVVAVAIEAVELYSDKYDYINIDEIMENERMREQYYNCFMDSGKCMTADAVFFKGNFPESIVTKCARCTEKQKENFDKVVIWYTEHQPEKWNTLVQKFISDARKQSAKSE